jgi:regulator of nucleoside diphosphate kinase
MTENIIVTTGIYDLIKEQIRRKQVSQAEEERLNMELKGAKQVLRRELPEDIVTVNRIVTVKDHTKNTEEKFHFVSTGKERRKKGKYSIMSDVGIATVGYKVGDTISWPFPTGERKLEIKKVELV